MPEKLRSAPLWFPDFRGALLFFDLSGTLVEQDAQISEHYKDTLLRLSAEAGQIVLVTGQSEDDPQVAAVCRFFVDETPVAFVAYVTRGGMRLVKRGSGLEKDLAYLEENRLDLSLQQALRAAITDTLTRNGLTPFIAVQCIDDVAMRVNLPPSDRPVFIDAMTKQLASAGLHGFQAVIEGRTSVFIMRRGVGKKKAVVFEMQLFLQHTPTAHAYFFGNEFNKDGNDHEVSDIPNLNLMPLGPYESIPETAAVQAIGHTPEDLYAFLRCTLPAKREADRSVPVVFISLGGTKIKIGAIDEHAQYTSEPEIYWRSEADFSEAIDDQIPARFCDVLVQRSEAFLSRRGYQWADVGTVGMGFPGPRSDGRWYSNNLTAAFREGVPLEDAFCQAITRRTQTSAPAAVRVVFDAQCDAGGELFHQQGRLFQSQQRGGRAVVLNVATGIAAGIIRDGRVLISDTDFATYVGSPYDGGAGQIGRHLWYHLEMQAWKYHYRARGATPVVPGAVRMTEYLSGPALAGRLLVMMGQAKALPQETWKHAHVPLQELYDLYNTLSVEPDIATGSQHVRRSGNLFSSALLSWADEVYRLGSPATAAACIGQFARTIAQELGAAIKVWAEAPRWRPFLRCLILTGGVGIRFLASSDSRPEDSFLGMLRKALGPEITVERSQLVDSTARGAPLFFRQPR